MAQRDIDVDLVVPFETIEDALGSTHSIFYSGEARSIGSGNADSFFPFDRIPWFRITDAKLRAVLLRFVFEREQSDIII